MTLRQLLLDVFLAADQPIQGGVHAIEGGLVNAEFLRQRRAAPLTCAGQLGTGSKQTLGDQGQDQVTLPGGLRGQQRIDAEFAHRAENGFDMAMRVGGQSAKSLRGRDESFSLEGSADDLNEAQRQMGKVTEGTVLDLAFVAVGLAQQKAGVGLALVLADNLGHMQGRGLHSHAVIIDTAPSRPRGAAKYSWLQMEAANQPKLLRA